jgi:hypothetical protein
MYIYIYTEIFIFIQYLCIFIYIPKYLYLYNICFIFYSLYSEDVMKLPTNPLRLFRTTNVRVSGVTESSGTSNLDNTYSKVISFFYPYVITISTY